MYPPAPWTSDSAQRPAPWTGCHARRPKTEARKQAQNDEAGSPARSRGSQLFAQGRLCSRGRGRGFKAPVAPQARQATPLDKFRWVDGESWCDTGEQGRELKEAGGRLGEAPTSNSPW